MPTCAKKITPGGFVAKKKKNTPVIVEQQYFEGTITKEKRRKTQVQHIKGANENNKNGNVASRTSCGLIIRFYLKFYFLNLAAEYCQTQNSEKKTGF